MFVYCMNNPVNMSDAEGNWPKWSTIVKKAVDYAVKAAVLVTTSVVGIVLVGMHYNRNILNKTDYTEQELLKENYKKEKEDKDKFHQNNQKNGERNHKYVIGDWFSSEIVYYSDGTINNTPEDRGTFNLYSGDNDFLNFVVHGFGDVVPYMIWGNSIDDSTTFVDRFIMIGE